MGVISTVEITTAFRVRARMCVLGTVPTVGAARPLLFHHNAKPRKLVHDAVVNDLLNWHVMVK